jgi:hypothetical protein
MASYDDEDVGQQSPIDEWLPVGDQLSMQQQRPRDEWLPVSQATRQQSKDEWLPVGQQPEAEGILGTFGREFAHEAGPTVAGAFTGAGTAGAAGTVLGPVGTLLSGLGGAMVGGYAASKAQSAAGNLLGFDDDLQRTANRQAHPWAAAAGDVLPALIPFGWGAKAGQAAAGVGGRALSGAITGGADVASQYAQTGTVDPVTALGSAATGFVAPYSRGFLAPAERLGAQIGERLKPAFHGAAASDTAGTASERAPPPDAKGGNTEQYAKGSDYEEAPDLSARPERPEPVEGSKDGPTPDPTLNAALDAGLKPPEPPPAAAPVEPAAAPTDPRDTPVPAWVTANRQEAIKAYAGTPIEHQVLDLARQGRTAAEIAQATGVDIGTIRHLRDNAGIAPVGPMGGMLTPDLPGRGTPPPPERPEPVEGSKVVETPRTMAADASTLRQAQDAQRAPDDVVRGPAPAAAAGGREYANLVYPEQPSFHDALVSSGHQYTTFEGADGRTYHRYTKGGTPQEALAGVTSAETPRTMAPAPADEAALPPAAEPAAPREAIAQRAPGETVGDALKQPAAAPGDPGAPGGPPRPAFQRLIVNRESNGRYSLTHGEQEIGRYATESEAKNAQKAKNIEIAKQMEAWRAATTPATPREAIAQRAPGETVGDALRRLPGGPGAPGGPPPRFTPPPSPPFTPGQPAPGQPLMPLRQIPGGPAPPGRGGPPPGGPAPPPGPFGKSSGGAAPGGPASMAYAPPQERSWLAEQARQLKLLTGARLGPFGDKAEQLIRGSYGQAQRLFEQSTNALAPHEETIRAMSPADRAAMNNRIEGGDAFPDWKPTPDQQRAMNSIKTVNDMWKDRLSRLGRTAEMDFIQNYLVHMYENPQDAQRFYSEFGKHGGAGSARARTLATYEDAKAAGLKPISDNPIELTTRYGMAMKNFIASNDARERAIADGVAGYFRSGKMVGATGSPEPLQVGGPPPGWKKLNAPTHPQGMDLYAPEDFADRYNTFYSNGMRGLHAPLYDALRNTNAAWTQLELGLNAYHFFTMANEAIISDVKKGFDQIFSGQIKGGLKSIGRAPGAPVLRAIEGRRFQQEYLDPNSANPIASILAEANARPIGRGHASDILGSADAASGRRPEAVRGSFIKNFSPNKISSEFNRAWDEIKQDWGLADTLGKQVQFPFKQASRIIQTTGAPLFDKYIPALKSGVLHSEMAGWLAANPHVDIATPEGRQAAVAAARKIVDSIDNRFGEMIHDNLFMNQTLRQSAMLAMRSFSWTVGAMREIAGGAYGAGKAGVLSIKNQENRFSMAHPEFDPRISYALALPFVVGTISTIYQYLRARERPQDWRDLYAPRTGGTVPGLGGKGKYPEHALMPGFQKDVYGWLMHPLRESYAKLGGLNTTLIEQIANEDWRGDPIYRRGAGPLEQLQERSAHLLGRFGPIGVRNMMKGQPETSHITPLETALGFRAPGVDIQDPAHLENWLKANAAKEWKAKERHEATERRKYARERAYDPREREQAPQ